MILVLYLIGYLSTVTFECPFKNQEQNLLSNENFYQSLQFQRDESEEQLGSSIGFQFWIQRDIFVHPKVAHKFQNPFQHDKKEDGKLIVTIEESNQIKYIFYSIENILYFKDVEKIEPTKLQELSDQTWNLFLIVMNKDLLSVQIIDQVFQKFSINIDSNILNLSLGGFQNINGSLNLNIFNGRATRLGTLGYLLLNEDLYYQLKNLCFMTQDFILQLEIYTLNENICPSECKQCQLDESYIKELNLICAKDQNYFNEIKKNCLVRNTFQREFVKLKQISNNLCFDWSSTSSRIYIIEEELKFNCKDGQFEAINNNIRFCIQCPFQNSKTIGCIECLLNMNTWFKEPICRSDFIRINDLSNSSYKYQERNEIEYDVFLIDDNNKLVHLEGVQKFCNFNFKHECFQLQRKHLNQLTYVQCKANYRQELDSCVPDHNSFDNIKNLYNLCKNGQYLHNEECLECPYSCLKCIFNGEKKSVTCNSCAEKFTLIKNICQPCGQFCLQCVSEYDKQSNETFLRCQRCVDDQKYYLSFDGVNCLQNQILNCKYAFQAFEDNLSISTLDYQFERQFNIEKIQSFCSRCLDYYAFVFPLKKCLKFINEQCIFGYSLQVFNQDSQTSNFDVVFDENQEIMISQIKCLIHNYNQSKMNCTFIKNCEICEYQEFSSQYICLRCIPGYYVSSFMDQCYYYNYNCAYCKLQDKYLKDSWKQQIRPFYFEFIEEPFNHPYTQQAQSQNKNDFEVICSACKNDQQEQNCTSIRGCANCQKNNNICTDCKNDDKITFTLQNNECNNCPTHCIVCKKKSDKELKKLNPYFQQPIGEEIFECPKLKDSGQYYDRDINQFIKCDTFKQGCQKVMVYIYMLSCEFYTYQIEYSYIGISGQMPDEEPLIKIPDIIYLAKQTKTKKMILRLISKYNSNCRLQDVVMNQDYSQNLFSFLQEFFLLSDVELEIICLHETIWNLEGDLTFEYFTKVTLNGLIIKVQQTWSQKQLIFKGLKQMKIIFNNVTFLHSTDRRDHFSIIFFNATNINFINSTFQNFYLIKNSSLITVNQANSNKTLLFSQINFQNLSLIDSQVLYVEKEKNIEFDCNILKFNNLQIRGLFFNSRLILSQELLDNHGQVEIYNFTILQSAIQNCKNFISFFTFKYIFINYFIIFEVNFTNSDIIQLSQQNLVYNMNISKCSLISSVCLIKNVDKNFIQHQFINISITENVYSNLSKFIFISKYTSVFSEFTLNNMTLKNNKMDELSFDINFMDPTSSLIFIEQDKINCSNIQIEKSYGLGEFTFQKSLSLILQSIIITQGKLFRQSSIYQQFECFLQTNQIKNNGITIFVFSAQHVLIHELIAEYGQFIDYPIIYYLSESKAIENQKEIITLQLH